MNFGKKKKTKISHFSHGISKISWPIKICMNILAKKFIKIPCFSLAWDLNNISEFWRNNELKSLNLALGFKKYV